MKTYLKLIGGAILIGSLFAFLFYFDINKEVEAVMKTNNTLYLFQVGVFQEKTNAEEYLNNFPSHYLYQDNEFYRVLICLTTKEDNKEKLIKYYNQKKYNFFVKEISLNENLAKELQNSEAILNKTTEEAAIETICQKQLDIFALSLKSRK